MFTVYILYSATYKKIYVGFTSDLEKRLASHNHLAKKGFTVKYRPWVVLYTETFTVKSEAIKRERQLKGGKGREFIKEMINQKFA